MYTLHNWHVVNQVTCLHRMFVNLGPLHDWHVVIILSHKVAGVGNVCYFSQVCIVCICMYVAYTKPIYTSRWDKYEGI
jgi:hypothetical protein